MDDIAHLLKQSILTQVLALITEAALVRAAVVVMPLLDFGGNRTSASCAVQEARKRELMFPPALRFAPKVHDFLRFVEQSLAHDWLERAGEQLPVHADDAVVHMMLEHLLDIGHWQHLAFSRAKSEASEFVTEREKRVCASGVQLERLAHDWRLLWIKIDVSFLSIVDVSQRSRPRPLASAYFLAHAALHVLGKVVHVIFGLTESDVEHEFPLRSRLKPEGRELQSFELAGVQKMHDLPSIHTVPGEPVRVPCENSFRSSLLDNFQHSGELGSPGLFCGFGLAERSDDFQLFFCGIFAQLTKLRVDRKNLTIILFCGFATVRNDFHGSRVTEKPAAGVRKGTRCSGKPRSAGACSRIHADFVIGGALSKKSEPILSRTGAAAEKPSGWGSRRASTKPAGHRSKTAKEPVKTIGMNFVFASGGLFCVEWTMSMLFFRTIAAILLFPFIWFINLFKRKNNILEWRLNFGRSTIDITTVSPAQPTEALLISAYLLFVGRYFFICDERQKHPVRQTLREVVNGESESKIAALHLYETAFATLSDGEKQAAHQMFMMGIPPIIITEGETSARSFAKYSFLVFVRNGELYGNFHMSVGADIVLLPITLGTLYDFVEAKVTGRNKTLLRNGVIALLEMQEEQGCRSILQLHQQPIEIIHSLHFDTPN
ncbi:MAG: hypothetical protein PHS73_00240 [Candidatus Peribacteraceae bacterium]|nr:hypothetical protein [Candidatus Peribacteraceae bacterium]